MCAFMPYRCFYKIMSVKQLKDFFPRSAMWKQFPRHGAGFSYLVLSVSRGEDARKRG